jgi:hypothetical protein
MDEEQSRPRVYIETSFVSACVTDRDDAASVYRRELSREWWSTQSHRYEISLSAEVIAELSSEGFRCREAALEFVQDLPALPINDEVLGLADLLVREKVMPAPVAGDAIHVAVATCHRVDYLLSWSVRHLANPSKIRHLQTICLRAGLTPPQILTPDLLWEENDG